MKTPFCAGLLVVWYFYVFGHLLFTYDIIINWSKIVCLKYLVIFTLRLKLKRTVHNNLPPTRNFFIHPSVLSGEV